MPDKVPIGRVDVPGLLKRLGLPTDKRKADDIYFQCLSGRHTDKTPSMHIGFRGPKKGLVNCWSCKWRGDLYDLVMKKVGCDFPDAVEFVSGAALPQEDWEPGKVEAPEATIREYLEPLRSRMPSSIDLPEGVFTRLSDRCAAYIEGRGISRELATQVGLLDWLGCSRLLVPIVVAGRCISYVARTYIDSDPKTLAPWDAPKQWELFGLDRCDPATATLELSEGWADSLMIGLAGFSNSVSVCGSSLSDKQVDMLDWARVVTVWRDGDKAGLGFAVEVSSWFGRGRELFVKDVQDLVAEAAKARLENRPSLVHDPSVIDRWLAGTANPDPGDFHPWALSTVRAQPWADYRRKL